MTAAEEEGGGSLSADGAGEQTLWQEFSVPFRFPVCFTRDAFSEANCLLAEVVLSAAGPAAIFPVADAGVAEAHPLLAERIRQYAGFYPEAVRLASPLQVLTGGEKCKEGAGEVEKLQRLFLEHDLCRHSVVLAIGGGAFLDVAGYAAATAHRGIRLLRMPTTTLSQNDSGVGVKNGYNAFGRKNWVGSFTPPFAVINDFDFLRTLSPRQCRAGMAEAVKVAAIKDAGFFSDLYAARSRLAGFCRGSVEAMIVRCAKLHMQHIAGGDPFELGSARPLDFGHWSAHALEEISGGEIMHGEAVAIGMALDCGYAASKGLISPREKELVVKLLLDLGFTLSHPALARIDLQQALDRFRQHLGGVLTVTLPAGIGRSVELHEMDLPQLDDSRQWLISLTDNTEDRHARQSHAFGGATAGARFPGVPLPTA